VGTDGLTSRVVADLGEQVGVVAEAGERDGHVQGGSAGMLTTTAVGVDDDVGEGFSGDQDSRGHRSIIAGFRGGGEQGDERVPWPGSPLDAARAAGRDNGPMHDAQPESPDRAASGDPSVGDETTDLVKGEAVDHAADEAPVERPKSAYQLPTKQNTVVRNIVWASVLTMAVVIVLAIGFFGVGSDLEREPLENSEVDVAASAERAQGVADFPVAVPATEDGWEVRSARFTDGTSPAWTVRYTSPGGALVTLAEDVEISAPVLSAEMPGAGVVEETSLEGADCQVLTGGEAGEDHLGIVCEGEDYGLLVHGAAERAELEQLMSEALANVG
jgi:hypothetical protein